MTEQDSKLELELCRESNMNRFAELVYAKILPLHGGALGVELNPTSSDAEAALQECFGDKYQRDFREGIVELFREAATQLIFDGVAYLVIALQTEYVRKERKLFEIKRQRVRLVRKEHVKVTDSGTYLLESSGYPNKEPAERKLNSTEFVQLALPNGTHKRLLTMVDELASLEHNFLPDFAIESIGSGTDSHFDFNEHKRKEAVLKSQITKGFGLIDHLSSNDVLAYYLWKRMLDFEMFLATLRYEILEKVNIVVLRVLEKVGHYGMIRLPLAATQDDVMEAQNALKAGSRSREEIFRKFK